MSSFWAIDLTCTYTRALYTTCMWPMLDMLHTTCVWPMSGIRYIQHICGPCQTYYVIYNMYVAHSRHVHVQTGCFYMHGAPNYLSQVSLQPCVHVFRLDEVFPGRVQVLLQLADAWGHGGHALLHLTQVRGLALHHLLELHHPHRTALVLVTQWAIRRPLRGEGGGG